MKYLLSIFLFVSFYASGQTLGQFRYDTSKFFKNGGVTVLKVEGAIQPSIYSSTFTTSANAPAIGQSFNLGTISADQTITFLDLESGRSGTFIYVYNSNASAFAWNIAGNVYEGDGTVISSLPKGLHIFNWIGSRWIRLSTSGGSSPTVDTLTFTAPLQQLDKNVYIDYSYFPNDTISFPIHGDSLYYATYYGARNGNPAYHDSIAILRITGGGGGSGNNVYNIDSLLASDRTIGGNGHTLTIAGTVAAAQLSVTNGDGTAVDASSLDGYGVAAGSGTNTGLYAASTTGQAIEGTIVPTAANTVVPVMSLYRKHASPTAGIGASLDLYNSTSTTFNGAISNSLQSSWTTSTHASRTSKFVITGVNSGTTTDWFSLIPSYGLLGTDTIATRAYARSVGGGGGGSGTVTSIAAGYGALGGTITTTGTISVDTNVVTSRLRDKKIIDSLAIVLQPNLSVYNSGATGERVLFVNSDTVWGKKLIGGTGITITNNADSTLTFAASGGTGWTQDGNTVGSEKWLGTIDNFAFPIRTNNTERARYTAGGQWLFKTTNTTLGGIAHGVIVNDTIYAQKLRIGGTWPVIAGINDAGLAIHGPGTTSSTYGIVNYDNGANINFAVRDDGQTTIARSLVLTSSSIRLNAGNFAFQPANSASITGYIHGYFLGNNFTGTSGIIDYEQFNYSILPTSGTLVHNVINIKPTVNQTGGASGKVRGIYFNPTNTASADLIAFEATAGRTIVQGVQTALVAKTTTYTATAADHTVTGDATSAAFTIALPAASSDIKGRIYTFKKIDSSGNAVTIDGNASETIDGATTYALGTQWKYVSIQCDGTNWIIVANN